MSNNIFSDDFCSYDEYSKMKNFEEAKKKHPSAAKTTKTNPARLTEEETAHVGLAVLEFLFVTIPLALLFTGLAVVPVTEAIFSAEIGFWTAFLLLLTLRWLIPRPRKSVLIRGGR